MPNVLADTKSLSSKLFESGCSGARRSEARCSKVRRSGHFPFMSYIDDHLILKSALE